MKKLELLPDKIFSVLCENIKDPHCIFIFPTDTVMNSWIDHLILNPDTSGVEALPFERFIAWDNFKGSYIQAKKEGYTAVPSILRKFFVSDIIARNAEKDEKDRLQVIINPKNEFAQNASSFEDWIAGNLKSLHFWKKRMDENSCEYGEPDSEDKDYLYIYEKYKAFLEANQLFEPSWIEDNDISDKDTRFILFYPELLEDFSDFLHIFDNAENLTVYTLPENLPEPKVYAYSDSRKELRQTMLRIIKLVKDGRADWSEIALSIPDIDTYRPYIDREFKQYGIPYVIKAGSPLTKNCAGRIFREIYDCYNTNFTYDSVRTLLLDECLPWKDEDLKNREELIREGSRMRCLCSPEEKDIWRQCFASKLARLSETNPEKARFEELQKFYNKLHKAVSAFFINDTQDFSHIRESWMSFKGLFLKTDSDFSVEANNIIARCIKELDELIRIQDKYKDCNLLIPSPYDFFLKVLDSKTYTPQTTATGVNIYKYKLTAAACFKYQFVIDASQKNIEVINRRLSFLNATKRSKLHLIDDDRSQNATEVFIKLYAKNAPEGFVTFSFATDSFAGFMISHSLLEEDKNPPILDEEDYILSEKNFILGKATSLKSVTAAQKNQFENWLTVNKTAEQKPYHLNEEMENRIKDHMGTENGESFIRVSARGDLEKFFPCPRRWVLQTLLKIKDDSLDTSLMQKYDMGNLNHKILELIMKEYEGKKLPTEFDDELAKLISDKVSEGIKAPSDFRDSFLAIKTLEIQKQKINAVITACISELIKPYGIEQGGFGGCTVIGAEKYISLKLPENDYILNGYIDCLLKTPESEYIIVDYKNSKNSIPSAKKNHADENGILLDFQMPVYYKLAGGTTFELFNEKIYGGYFFSIKDAKATAVTEKGNKKASPEDFDDTLRITDEYAALFADAVKRRDFTPLSSNDIKDRQNVSEYLNCFDCPCKAICRTTFTTGGKKLALEAAK